MGEKSTEITKKLAGIFLKHSATVRQDQPHQGKNLPFVRLQNIIYYIHTLFEARLAL